MCFSADVVVARRIAGPVAGERGAVLADNGVARYRALCATSHGLSYLAANRVIILFLFELVFAAIASYFLAGEVMWLRDWMGATLIVSASLLSGRLHEPEKIKQHL